MKGNRKGKNWKDHSDFWTVPKRWRKVYDKMRRHKDKQELRNGKEPEVRKKYHRWNYW